MMGRSMMNQVQPWMMNNAMMPMMHMMETGMMGPGMMSWGAMGPGAMCPGMMSGGMMGSNMMGQVTTGPMMYHSQIGMMGMSGAPSSYLEARLAFVKAELAIDDAQEAAWQKYAAALRSQIEPTTERMSSMRQAMAGGQDFPAAFDARVSFLEGQLEDLKAVRDAAVGLYGQLNPQQQRQADRLLPMSLCM
ncbi:MAG: Spy/CpxP family protein refolding chaperone [Dongiaceae bacterium]